MYSSINSIIISNLILFLVVLLIRKLVNKEGLKDFLIHLDKKGVKLFLQGIIAGIIGFILYTVIVYLSGKGTFIYQNGKFKESLLLFFLYGIAFLAVALFEESLFRGYILQKLLKKYSITKSIIISSVIFGSLHFFSYSSSYYFWIGLTNASILGILFSIITVKTKSLMIAIGFHLSWNLIQQLLLFNGIYKNNLTINFRIKEGLLSGTYFVPESGLAVSLVLLIISIYIFLKFRNVKS